MNILYIASEALPFAASGGLADVAGSLPPALNAKGHDCRVVMPLYGTIPADARASMTFLGSFEAEVSWRKQYCGVYTVQARGVTYYLLDNEYYFKRHGLYGYYDDAERFTFFSRAVLELLRVIDFKPQILHANDWQSALVPVYYNVFYRHQPGYEDMRTVFTIHNIQYQGKYGLELIEDILGLPMYASTLVEYDGCVNLMKGAIEASDKVTTVSTSYAQEILDPWYAYGLDRILRERQHKLFGILNGIDRVTNNPETDPLIPANYSADDKKGKAVCKETLQIERGLTPDKEPLVAVISRLVPNKGIDLIRTVFEEMMEAGVQFVLLGSGEREYEEFFHAMQDQYPGKVSCVIGFDAELAHRIYAGADILLMPSQTEPCGLAQMIALRYGTIPIVRETGGLRDSIKDAGGKGGNGFTFQSINAYDMLEAVRRALEYYAQRMRWGKLVSHGMRQDFGWGVSAELYLGLYRELTGEG